jgi:cytochrome b subunit of formate dehydrogenase
MHWGYVIVGYVVVFAGLALYIGGLLTRAKQLSARVPEDRRRFLRD